jgi:pimeloyl-ACP methyl ester carboxylesterase
MPPREEAIPYRSGDRFYRMAFRDWGDPAAPVLLCVHGLTRNGHDFDPLAEALSDRFRVVCPDLPGRGASDWFDDPMMYQAQFYVGALTHLLAWINRPVDWLGTSLGGICGMIVTASHGAPIRRLILNDIGPFIPADALRRIRDYMVASGDSPVMSRFSDLDAVARHLQLVHAPFGPLTDAQWTWLAQISARDLPDGRFTMHYDPKLSEPLRGHEPTDVDMWSLWDRIQQPRLVIRGETSDILLPETLQRMQASGAIAYVVPEAGHAPALLDPGQIDVIRRFLTD